MPAYERCGDLSLTCKFNVESGKFPLSFRPCCSRGWMSMEKRSKFSRDAAADAFMYSALSSSTNGSLNGRRGGSRLCKPDSKIWLRELRQGGEALLLLHAVCWSGLSVIAETVLLSVSALPPCFFSFPSVTL